MRLLFVLFFVLTPCTQASAQSGFEAQMRRAGLTDVGLLDTTLRVQLIYATDDNFMRRNVYGELRRAYLLPHFARKVVLAQRVLRKLRPGWRLLICDAARPLSIQRTMYALVAGTPNQVYVANGERGGRHNYGVAVDVTLLDATGSPTDMGTPVDFMGEASHVDREDSLVRVGVISPTAARNRALLRTVMREVGLVVYRREWWHFEESERMADVRTKYRRLDF